MLPFEALRMRKPGISAIDGTLGSVDSGILAAVLFSVSGGVPTIIGQKNVSGVSRLVQGVYRVTFNSALANTNYGLLASARRAAAGTHDVMLAQPSRDTTSSRNSYSTTQVDVATQLQGGGTTGTDPILCMVIAYDPAGVSSSNYLAAASWTLSGTTVTLQRQTNVSGVARQAAGVYRASFSSALANADYDEHAMSRFTDFANMSLAISGQNRNTSGPRNLHSTASLDICGGRYNASSGSGMFDTARGSVLIGTPSVAPRGTLAKVRFSMSGGVATIVSQYNVASITVHATGVYRVNFTTPLVDTDYGVLASGKWNNSTDDDTPVISTDNNTSSGHTIYSTTGVDIAAKGYGGSLFDPDFVNVWVLKPALM